jgi:hypothetical protein
MTYCERLEQFRNEILAEFSRQLPTKHDSINLTDEDDEDNRENVPMVRIHWKHYCYSCEYILRLENKDGQIFAVAENAEDGNWNSYDLSEFTTSELCEILDTVIEKVISNKK